MTPYDAPDDDLPALQEDDSIERHTLEAECELRIETSQTSPLTVTLQRGSAELFGVELASRKAYEFPKASKMAFFTWHGCVLDVKCDAGDVFAYTVNSDDCTHNVAFVNTHAQLEAMRDVALSNNTEGPRVLVVGAANTGKSTLCRVLASYACKLQRAPLFVDLDPNDGSISIPGTLSVAPITLSSFSVLEYDSIIDTTPLNLWFGSTNLSSNNKDLYQAQVSALGRKMDQRLSTDTDTARASGIIVNTNGWLADVEGYDMLLHTVQALNIAVILVLGHDRLYSQLMMDYKDSNSAALKIIKLPRSGGVVNRDTSALRQARSQHMKRYFYGTASQKLTPFLAHVPISKLTIYKYSSLALSASLLPVSSTQATEKVQLVHVTDIEESLQHAVLAVCHPHAVQEYDKMGSFETLYEQGVAGFVVVERVLAEADMIHLLSPCAGTLPSHTLILGDNITWME